MGRSSGYAWDAMVLNDPIITGGTLSNVTVESDNVMFDGLTGLFGGLTTYTTSVTVTNGNTTGKEAAIGIPTNFVPAWVAVHVTTAATNAVNLVDIGDDADTDSFVDGIAVAVNSTGYKGLFACNGIRGAGAGITGNAGGLATADEVEIVLGGDPGATGATIRFTFFGLRAETTDFSA